MTRESGGLTETVLLITQTTLPPHAIIQRTVTPVVVLVSYLFKEMDLVFSQEQCSSDAVDGCISPTLIQFFLGTAGWRDMIE
jgi:hypothetical protein